MYQKERPVKEWLVFDTTPSIRETSTPVAFPLSDQDKDAMHRLIDFVQCSQDPELNADRQLRPAVGLAAPQIGVNKQMYYIRIQKFNDQDEVVEEIEHAMINPKITGYSEQKVCIEEGEGCLSVKKDHEGLVPRSYKIFIEGFDYLKNEQVKLTARGYEAIVFQHEQLHLEGKLYYDLINKRNPWKMEKDWITV